METSVSKKQRLSSFVDENVVIQATQTINKPSLLDQSELINEKHPIEYSTLVLRANDIIRLCFVGKIPQTEQTGNGYLHWAMLGCSQPDFTHQIFENEVIDYIPSGYKDVIIYIYVDTSSLKHVVQLSWNDIDATHELQWTNRLISSLSKALPAVTPTMFDHGTTHNLKYPGNSLLCDSIISLLTSTSFTDYIVSAPAKQIPPCLNEPQEGSKVERGCTTGEPPESINDYYPPGRKIHSFSIPLPQNKRIPVCDSASSSGRLTAKDDYQYPDQSTEAISIKKEQLQGECNDEYEVWLATDKDPGAAELLHRAEKLAMWYIETADGVDFSDDRWEVLFVFQRSTRVQEHEPPVCHQRLALQSSCSSSSSSSSSSNSSYLFVGYMTLFSFRNPLAGTRLRVCQALVLPPYQGRGVGREALLAAYELCASRVDVVELTVEDPAPGFQRLRDAVDLEWALSKLDKLRACTVRCSGQVCSVAASAPWTSSTLSASLEVPPLPPSSTPQPQLLYGKYTVAELASELKITKAQAQFLDEAFSYLDICRAVLKDAVATTTSTTGQIPVSLVTGVPIIHSPSPQANCGPENFYPQGGIGVISADSQQASMLEVVSQNSDPSTSIVECFATHPHQQGPRVTSEAFVKAEWTSISALLVGNQTIRPDNIISDSKPMSTSDACCDELGRAKDGNINYTPTSITDRDEFRTLRVRAKKRLLRLHELGPLLKQDKQQAQQQLAELFDEELLRYRAVLRTAYRLTLLQLS